MTEQLNFTGVAMSSATISADGLYRYDLSRRWDDGPRACWVMLNPSTADAALDDPTIRRCIGFSRAAGMGALVVVNLYAYRATNPAELSNVADPGGPENPGALAWHTSRAAIVIAAWGAHAAAAAAPNRWGLFSHMADAGRRLWCLGTTRSGAPRHPLYVAGATPLQPYEPFA